MRSLEKWQLISMFSRMIAMFLGLFQTFFIIRILTPSEWGIIQIGMALGGAFGIYQHLGLSSGSTREISTAKKESDIFKIFFTSVAIRYLVTIPISLFLYLGAEKLAVGQYNQPILVLPIKIYAFVLLIQGAKGLINSVVAGTKRFRALFIYQAAITIVSVLVYIPLVYYKGIVGFFLAFLAFEFISTLVLGYIAFKPLKGNILFPSKADFVRLSKQLFSIMFAIYIVKVLVTQWEKAGTILLGRDVTPEAVAVFSFAFLFSKKLMHISDAITDVNLPIFSDELATDIQKFKSLFIPNLNKVFVFMLFSATSAVFWARELVYIFIGNNPVYQASFPLFVPLIFAFIFYGVSDILKSSIFVPAKLVKELLGGYLLMMVCTVILYLGITRFTALTPVYVITLGSLIGAFSGFVFLVLTSQKKLGFRYIGHDHVLLLIQALAIMLSGSISILWLKLPVYLVFIFLFGWASYGCGFIKKDDIAAFTAKFASVKTFLKK